MTDFKVNGGPASVDFSIDQTKAIGRKPTLNQAGKAFESLFLQSIMKAMREAKLDDGLFDGDAQKPFEAMLDHAYSDKAAKNLRLGLSEAITRQFTPDHWKPKQK
jgi:Rod binding domain-containing protein